VRPRKPLRVWVDFDGTVACEDVTDAVLRRFAAPDWEAIEAAWLAGEIDAATCMRRQIALIEAPAAELDAFLDGVEVDPGFAKFANWCRDAAIPLAVASDGVEYFARRILSRHGFAELAVFANRLVLDAGRYALAHPWRDTECRSGAGVCKCAVAAGRGWTNRHPLVYVGDGRSDRCVAERAELLFAKGELAAHCDARGIAYRKWLTFEDVLEALA